MNPHLLSDFAQSKNRPQTKIEMRDLPRINRQYENEISRRSSYVNRPSNDEMLTEDTPVINRPIQRDQLVLNPNNDTFRPVVDEKPQMRLLENQQNLQENHQLIQNVAVNVPGNKPNLQEINQGNENPQNIDPVNNQNVEKSNTKKSTTTRYYPRNG